VSASAAAPIVVSHGPLPATRLRGLAAILTLTVFVNAALMFSVEPMFSKLVLPFLGGTPSVWNTCLMFFQAALLVGYGYAHLSSRLLNPRRHAVVHTTLLALSCVVLPLQIRSQGGPPAGGQGILWLLIVLTTSLGIPFVKLPKLDGGLWHPYRRAWATSRKHLPTVDVAAAGGWSDVGTLLRCYQRPDDDTMLQVMGESRKIMERAKTG